MGDIADRHVDNFASGRWGVPMRSGPAHPTISRAEIAEREFKIVLVLGDRWGTPEVPTNRIPGTKLVVCNKDENSYWVWARERVTGIHKKSCKVLSEGHTLNQALALLGRKLYGNERKSTMSAASGMAFGISSDDVLTVLASHPLERGYKAGDEQLAEDLLAQIDAAAVEAAALHGNSMDEQTNYAHEEIARQLRERGVLSPEGQQRDAPRP